MANAIIAALNVYSNKMVFQPIIGSIIARTFNNPEIFEYSPHGKKTLVREIVPGALTDYDPTDGFSNDGTNGGQVKWNEFEAPYDRKIVLDIDAMQELESVNQGQTLSGIGVLASTFRKAGAEIDAVCFADLFSKVKVGNVSTNAAAWGPTGAYNTLLDIESNLFNAGVTEHAFVYIASSKYANVLKSLVSNNLAANETAFEFFAGPDGDSVTIDLVRYNKLFLVRVPDERMYTEITLLDGKTVSQEAGGFAPSEEAKKIHALVVPYEAGSFSYRHVVANFSVPQSFANLLPSDLGLVQREITDNLKNQVTLQHIGINQTADKFQYNNRLIYGVATFENFEHSLYAYTDV